MHKGFHTRKYGLKIERTHVTKTVMERTSFMSFKEGFERKDSIANTKLVGIGGEDWATENHESNNNVIGTKSNGVKRNGYSTSAYQ